jgi:hypothetical protein
MPPSKKTSKQQYRSLPKLKLDPVIGQGRGYFVALDLLGSSILYQQTVIDLDLNLELIQV